MSRSLQWRCPVSQAITTHYAHCDSDSAVAAVASSAQSIGDARCESGSGGSGGGGGRRGRGGGGRERSSGGGGSSSSTAVVLSRRVRSPGSNGYDAIRLLRVLLLVWGSVRVGVCDTTHAIPLTSGVHNITMSGATGITVYSTQSGQGGQLVFTVSIVGQVLAGYATPWVYIYSGPSVPGDIAAPAFTGAALELNYVLDPCYYATGGAWYFGVVTRSRDDGMYNQQVPREMDVVYVYTVCVNARVAAAPVRHTDAQDKGCTQLMTYMLVIGIPAMVIAVMCGVFCWRMRGVHRVGAS